MFDKMATSFSCMTEQLESPLAGLEVVEITSIYSGPMAGMMLAELLSLIHI